MGFKPVNLNSSYIYLDDYEKYNPEFKFVFFIRTASLPKKSEIMAESMSELLSNLM